MRRALIIGGSGFVGRRLASVLGERAVATFRSRPLVDGIPFDASRERLRDRLASLPADLTHVFVPFGVIDMEGCARDPVATARINVEAVIAVLDDALAAGLAPLFVSTDYVFDGERGDWRETDEARPRMAYGAQKLAVEQWLKDRPGPWIIARLSKVLSSELSAQNQLAEWRRAAIAREPIRCADDQVFSPAGAGDLAKAMVGLAAAGARGLFHVAGPTSFSRLELLHLLAARARNIDPSLDFDIRPCSLRDFPFLERRPLDTSLNTDKLRDQLNPHFQSIEALCDGLLRAGSAAAEGKHRELSVDDTSQQKITPATSTR